VSKRDKIITFLIIIAVCFTIPTVIGLGVKQLEASGPSRSLLMAWNGEHDGAIGFFRNLIMSEKTRALITTNHTKAEILDGHHYYIEGWTTLGDGETLFIQMLSPDAPRMMHLTWKIQSSGILETYLLEDATGGMAGGTVITPLNSDRNSANTSDVRLWQGVTTCVSGTTIANSRVGAAAFKGSVGGDPSRADMLVVKSGVSHMRAFKSFTAGNNISFRAGWDEHENWSK